MALTAGQIIALAMESAHSPGKALQAQFLFNSILTEICQTYDLAEARGQYNFEFRPNAAPPVGKRPSFFDPPKPDVGDRWNQARWGQAEFATTQHIVPLPSYPGNQFGSGPYLLPVDYLRLSGSSGSSGNQRSFIWWLAGVPYPVIPMDLAEFDLQIQQAGLQSFVWLSASDMSAPIDDRIILTTTGDVRAGSHILHNLASTDRLIPGSILGIGGQGIIPGTMLISSSPDGSGVMDQPANATILGASLMFGFPPTIYIYPPPQEPLQALIRYQKRMPDVADWTRYPWFHNDSYLLDKLTGKLCRLNDDDRATLLLGGPDVPGTPDSQLRNWLASTDDNPSHPKRVELDRRSFGRGWAGSQRITKRVGW